MAQRKTRGSRFLEAVTGTYEGLTPAETELALEASRLLDLVETLNAAVAERGALLGDRPNPALVELRYARETLRKTLATLNLPDLDGETPTMRRARRAGRGNAS